MNGLCFVRRWHETTTSNRKWYHFLSRFLSFMMFLVFFILRSLKRNKIVYSTIRRKQVLQGSKLVPSSGTYLCSMQGSMCKIRTLEGRSPPSNVWSSYKGYKKGSVWLGLRQAHATWLINRNQRADVKLNKARKTHEMHLQLNIYKGVPGEWPA